MSAKELTADERIVKGYIEIGSLIPVKDAEEYKWVRPRLHNVATWFVDSGQGIKAVIALQEIARLDQRFSSDE